MEQAPLHIPEAPIRIEVGGIDVNQIAGTGSLNIGETYNFRLQTGRNQHGKEDWAQVRDQPGESGKGRDR